MLREFEDIQKRQLQANEAEDRVIKNMSLDQRNNFTRNERVMQSYSHHVEDWDKQINRIVRKSERTPSSSCMLRGEEHRRKLEMYQAFESLKTDEERFGKRIWYMHLRKYDKPKK